MKLFLSILIIVLWSSIQSYGQTNTSSMFDQYVIAKDKIPQKYSFLKPIHTNTQLEQIPSLMFKPVLHKDMALFCRLEHAVLKESNLAVKFRLGDVQYVDKLEGKN